MKILAMVLFMLYISSGCVAFDTRSKSQRNIEDCIVRLLNEGVAADEARTACLKIYRGGSAKLDSSTDLKAEIK